jgi:3-oxoacyl-[acyl-carrier protein] reductase
MNLSGKVALVTGSSRGIGQAIALKLAGAGADIVLNDIAAAVDALERTTTEIKVFNRKVLAIPADVSSTEDVNKMVDKAIEVFGHIDILVNNAGVTRDALVMRMTDEDWNTVLNIDLKSVFLCSRAVLRQMLKQRSGRIVSIASIVGLTGNAGQANYSSAKAGIIAFTKSLAKEVGSRGITVNAIAPGYIGTQMTEKLDEAHKKAFLDRIPLGTAGTPRDIAEAVAFLASDEARYITGQTLNVDGGLALG